MLSVVQELLDSVQVIMGPHGQHSGQEMRTAELDL